MTLPTHAFAAMKMLAVILLLGAVVGLAFGVTVILLLGLAHYGTIGPFFWVRISHLEEFWQWPLVGVGFAALGYAAWRLLGHSTQDISAEPARDRR